MKVKLTWTQTAQREIPAAAQTAVLELEGSPAEMQEAITEMFDADCANSLRREFGLKGISACSARDITHNRAVMQENG